MAISTDIDKIRLEIGDVVNRTDGLTLQDDEITYALTIEADFWGAAARCAEFLSARFLLKANTQLGRQLKIEYTKTAEQYAKMAERLRAKSMGTALPWFGGQSLSDKETLAADTDLPQPAFTRTMQQNPRVGGVTSDSDADSDGD